MERRSPIARYFIHILVDRSYGLEEAEYFFKGKDLGDVFHDITSTVRYYASRCCYDDAWNAYGDVINDDTGEYLCSVAASAYNPGIIVIRKEGEEE